MNVDVLDTIRGTMAEDTYVYFMAAWKHFMRQTKYTQRRIAVETGNSAQWINCAFKERPDTKSGKVPKVSLGLQEKIAEIFGYNYIEFLQAGKRVLENIPGVKVEKDTIDERPNKPIQSSLLIPGTQARHVNPNDIMTEMAVFVGQYQKNSERLKFWKAIFENLPVPALIIKDGLVIYQNSKSRAWGSITGSCLCDSCMNKGCGTKDDCPVNMAVETATEQSGYRVVNSMRYKVDVVPLDMLEHDYFIVLATEAALEVEEGERRSGDDRRVEGSQ